MVNFRGDSPDWRAARHGWCDCSTQSGTRPTEANLKAETARGNLEAECNVGSSAVPWTYGDTASTTSVLVEMVQVCSNHNFILDVCMEHLSSVQYPPSFHYSGRLRTGFPVH